MNNTKIAPGAKPAGVRAAGGTHSPHRILVVDDDVTLRKMNKELLGYSGYHVDDAEDGEAAWETLHAKKYDLLVTDHNMPKLSGLDLLKKLRSAGMDLPVILVSGMMPTEELQRHAWLQIDATLMKPFSTSELLEKVKDVLSERKVIPFPLFAEGGDPNRIAAPAPEQADVISLMARLPSGTAFQDESERNHPNWR
jgi:two-component system chemotaxis response regulator CheY